MFFSRRHCWEIRFCARFRSELSGAGPAAAFLLVGRREELIVLLGDIAMGLLDSLQEKSDVGETEQGDLRGGLGDVTKGERGPPKVARGHPGSSGQHPA